MDDTKQLFSPQPVTDILRLNYMPYAMSVIISRAIPEIDGFKPSHRKLLYTMYKMGLLTGARTKSSNVVGQTMKLSPHGDMAIYETLVRLTRGYEALLHPFVDSKGNFGKQYSRDMAYAAPRYTEVKLDPICAEIFEDIDKDTVDFVDNYDSTTKEPVLLPTAFPNILVSPNQGIAVGMASNIPSFNLREVCEATIAYMKNPDADLLEFMPAPDFSTGALLLYDQEKMREIYRTGGGSFSLRAVYRYDKKNNCIEITQIPYTTTSEAIIGKLVDLIKAGKVREISDIRDETDINGLKITLDLKRGTDPDLLMTRLYKLTPLEDSFSCNFNVLIQGRPMVLGVYSILEEWVKFRIDCIKRRLKFDIDKKTKQLHLLNGLEKILLDIDKAISIIRNTELDAMVVPNLMKGFLIDQEQAEFIAEIKLRNLNREYILKRTRDIETLTGEIEDLTATLKSEARIKKLIESQLRAISKKYGQDRKTRLISQSNLYYDEEQFIDDYDLTLFLTNENYLKKISAASLRASGTEHKLKDDDYITQEAETTNKSELLLFSDKCNVYKTRIHDIPDSKVSLMGEYLPNLLKMEPDEKIIFMHPTSDYSGHMLFCFQNGRAVKVPVSAYVTKTNRQRLVNAYYAGSPVVYMTWLNEQQDRDLVAYSNNGKALAFNTSKIPIKITKTAQGVQVMLSRKNSLVLAVRPAELSGIKDLQYYKTKNIPAAGRVLKEQDLPAKQLTLL